MIELDLDKQKFNKLRISTVAELAILAPSKYEDTRVYNTLLADQDQVIDVDILSINSRPTVVSIMLFCHNLNIEIEAVLFKPKPFMLRQFVVGSRAIFFGRITQNGSKTQVVHPKPLTKYGTITPQYRSALRSDTMQKLISRYITQERLRSEDLPEHVITELLKLHFPQTLPPQNMTQDALYALKYTELYAHLKALKNSRRYFDAEVLDGEVQSWIDSLPFVLTQDQLLAIKSIQQDFSKPIASKRVIVGDVGSGKTVVILASVMMARPHKVILMAPTTILANQLYDEATKHLKQIKITLVTSSSSKKLSLADYDLLIGTHALLYKELPEVALVMVDEQHRFGTLQRKLLEKLVTKGSLRPHYLQFSATPIPRTQAMIDSAYVDVSLIKTTPFKRVVHSSVIGKSEFSSLLEHIKSEVSQGRQVLIVYPLVEQSDSLEYSSLSEAKEFWQKRFKGLFVTHGKDRDKEALLEEFKDSGEVLLATTVVEVGISLPKLSTVVIVGAERLGLATLHQLRGRVSRNGLEGYCFLYTNQKSNERLEQFVKIDNGFDIAALDLAYRKSGDIVNGDIQSGKKFLWADLADDEKIVELILKRL